MATSLVHLYLVCVHQRLTRSPPRPFHLDSSLLSLAHRPSTGFTNRINPSSCSVAGAKRNSEPIEMDTSGQHKHFKRRLFSVNHDGEQTAHCQTERIRRLKEINSLDDDEEDDMTPETEGTSDDEPRGLKVEDEMMFELQQVNESSDSNELDSTSPSSISAPNGQYKITTMAHNMMHSNGNASANTYSNGQQTQLQQQQHQQQYQQSQKQLQHQTNGLMHLSNNIGVDSSKKMSIMLRKNSSSANHHDLAGSVDECSQQEQIYHLNYHHQHELQHIHRFRMSNPMKVSHSYQAALIN